MDFSLRALLRRRELELLGLRDRHAALDARDDDGCDACTTTAIRRTAPSICIRSSGTLPLLAVAEHGLFDAGVGGRASQAPCVLREGRRSAQPAAVRAQEGVARRRRALSRRARASRETIEKYAKGTPNDWLENNLYHHPKWSYLGIFLLVVADLVLFGVPGIIMIALQLVEHAVPRGRHHQRRCHAKGYRNFETDDASTNLWPLGLLVAGEELHNNHHAFPTSARFSMRRYEVDMGWLHLKALELVGLAKIRRVATPPELVSKSGTLDLDELRAIIVNRMHVLRHYTQSVTLPVLRRDVESRGDNANAMVRAARKLLSWQPHMLDELSRKRLAEIAERHPRFQTVLQFRKELGSLWEGAHTSNERLLADFREWCTRAEQSGISGLQDFVAYLKSFRAMRESALA